VAHPLQSHRKGWVAVVVAVVVAVAVRLVEMRPFPSRYGGRNPAKAPSMRTLSIDARLTWHHILPVTPSRMRLREKLARSIAIFSTTVLILCGGCGGGGGGAPQTYPSAAISISPQVAAIPVNGTQTFTATVTNDSYTPQWTIMGSAADSPVGTLTPQSGTGSTITYTAPAVPPLYGTIQLSTTPLEIARIYQQKGRPTGRPFFLTISRT